MAIDGSPNPENGCCGSQGNLWENVTPGNNLWVPTLQQLNYRLNKGVSPALQPCRSWQPWKKKSGNFYPAKAVLWDALARGPPFWDWARCKQTPQVLFGIFFVPPPLYQSVIHASSVLLCLAPQSTHGNLFLRHRQMGSSLESCSELEKGDCSFQERESFRSTGICSCFRATTSQGTFRSSQLSCLHVNKGLNT